MGGNNDIPHGRGPVSSSKASQTPWEPSVRDLEIYAGLTEGRSTRDLGAEFGLSNVQIGRIGSRIDKWLAPQWMDRIRELKSRHSESLMVVFREQMEAWRKSKNDSVTSTDKTTPHGDEQSITRKAQSGNTSHHKTAMDALADIRKIWGADAAEPSDPAEFRVAGRPREEAIREHIERLQAIIEPQNN